MAEERIIKKYRNRRLYDTSISQYITLEVVKNLVLEGVVFKVIDARTRKDITHSTLLQIIADQEEKGEPILTTDVLRNLIRLYGKGKTSVVGHYLEQCLIFYMENQPALKDKLNDFFTQVPLSAISELAEENFKFWRKVYGNFYRGVAKGKNKP